MANNGKNSNMIVGLDIGTSKVVCIDCKNNEERKLEIVALGAYPSSGLKKGVVVNIDATTDAISKAVEQAQSMIEDKIKSVFVGIAGNHIKSLNSQGAVGIKDNEVSSFDIDRVIEAAQAVSIPSDQRVLHVLPQSVTDIWVQLPTPLLTLVFATPMLGRPIPRGRGLWKPVASQSLVGLLMGFGEYLRFLGLNSL